MVLSSQMKKVLVLIPARYESTRFPGKPLTKIQVKGHEKSMIQIVAENMQQSGYVTCVVTDDKRIENHLNDLGLNVKRVDDDVPSGTERIKLCYERYFSDQDFDLIVNVQGDEPLLKSDVVTDLAEFHMQSDYPMGTVIVPRDFQNSNWSNPNVVKAVFSEKTNECFYFSRASVPYQRSNAKNWYQHVGIYSFTPKALNEFASLPKSDLEQTEGLEQLRAIENKMRIGAIKKDIELLGVDTPEDVQRVEELL